jgi:hypothetical protein
MKKIKVILDFDGTLTDEARQAEELESLAKKMLAEEILELELEKIESLYSKVRREILNKPHKYHWEVNGLPATYAYEGAYLLNTSILQNVIGSDKKFVEKVRKKFPAKRLDSVTRCSNHLFHKCTMEVQPHFLDGARDLLIWMIEHDILEPVILSNSESRKIGRNLELIEVGEKNTNHGFGYEIEILGDTRQYHMDSEWEESFEHDDHGEIQVLPITDKFEIDLRRPVYHKALTRVEEEGNDEIVVVADGFSLAGSLPLVMGMRFILKKTPHTPRWVESYIEDHVNGSVVEDLGQLKIELASLVK